MCGFTIGMQNLHIFFDPSFKDTSPLVSLCMQSLVSLCMLSWLYQRKLTSSSQVLYMVSRDAKNLSLPYITQVQSDTSLKYEDDDSLPSGNGSWNRYV